MKQDQLHLLLRNMTKSEKRYFRLFSKRSGDKSPKNYLHLFEILENMAEYDEELLVNLLQERGVNTKYLSADKNYLYTSLLDALRTYNAVYSAKQQVRRQLDFADILAEKGLKKAALKNLKKAQSLALNNDAIQYLPEILQDQRRLSDRLIHLREIEKRYAEMYDAITRTENTAEYEFCFHRHNLLRLRYGKTDNPEKVKQSDRLWAELHRRHPVPLGFSAQKYNLQTRAIRNYMLNNTEEEFKNNEDLLRLMTDTPGWLKVNPLEYISVFSRILILSKQVAPKRYPDLYRRFLAFADEVNRENRKVKARVYTIAYGTEMVRIIKQGDFKEGKKLIPQVLKVMNDYADIINPAFALNNFYKFAYIQIGNDDYEKAAEYLNIVLDDFSATLRPDIYGYAKILLCICHYELGNFTLLPHLTATAVYYLRKEQRLFDTERIFLRHISNFAKTSPNRHDFFALKEQINTLDDSRENAQDYFDFNRWIAARAAGISFGSLE